MSVQIFSFFGLDVSEGSRRSQGDKAMATTARFTSGRSSSPSTPTPATTPPTQSQPTQLIVLPASLHQVIHTLSYYSPFLLVLSLLIIHFFFPHKILISSRLHHFIFNVDYVFTFYLNQAVLSLF